MARSDYDRSKLSNDSNTGYSIHLTIKLYVTSVAKLWVPVVGLSITLPLAWIVCLPGDKGFNNNHQPPEIAYVEPPRAPNISVFGNVALNNGD